MCAELSLFVPVRNAVHCTTAVLLTFLSKHRLRLLLNRIGGPSPERCGTRAPH